MTTAPGARPSRIPAGSFGMFFSGMVTTTTSAPFAASVPVTEAAKGADVVVVTIPEKNIPKLPAGILEGLAPGAVVIDTGNYYPQQRDGRIEDIENGTPESLW